MIIYNQLKIFSLFCFCCCFFTNPCYFFWRMAYRHLITFDFVYSMFFYNLLFTFICNCLWLVIYNPVLLIAIWPPSPSLSLWSPPRSGEWEYWVYVRWRAKPFRITLICKSKMFKQNLFSTLSKTRECKTFCGGALICASEQKLVSLCYLPFTSTYHPM